MNHQKSEFFQIRVTPHEKKVIQQQAEKMGLDMTSWVKQQLFSSKTREYFDLVSGTLDSKDMRESLAHLNSLLHELSKRDFIEVVQDLPEHFLHTFAGNYIAAMVEMAAFQKNIPPPNWVKKYEGLAEPYFPSDLKSLRLHLLVSSPIPFRKRNIFIDSTVGDRV